MWTHGYTHARGLGRRYVSSPVSSHCELIKLVTDQRISPAFNKKIKKQDEQRKLNCAIVIHACLSIIKMESKEMIFKPFRGTLSDKNEYFY